MISIQKGEDLLSIALCTILSYRKNESEFQKLVLNWNKKILIEIEDFYPIEIIFDHDEIKFKVIDIFWILKNFYISIFNFPILIER